MLSRLFCVLAVVLGVGIYLFGCGGEKQADSSPEDQAKPASAEEQKPRGDAARRLLFEKRCNDGHFGLCGELGLMWERGWGGQRDKAKADEYYKIACDHAVPKACERLAKELKPADQQRIHEEDCAKGNGFACNNLGHMLLGDMGIPKDEARARELLDKACSAGYPASCITLEKMLSTGVGGPEDKERAEQVLEKAKAAVQAEEALKVEYLGTPPRDKLPVVKPSEEFLEKVMSGAPAEGAGEKKDGADDHNHGHNH